MTTPSIHLDAIRASRIDLITLLNTMQECIAMHDYEGIDGCCLDMELIVEGIRESARCLTVGQYCAPRGDI